MIYIRNIELIFKSQNSLRMSCLLQADQVVNFMFKVSRIKDELSPTGKPS